MVFAQLAFWTGFGAATAIIGSLIVTLRTRVSLWPPGEHSGKAALHWGLVAIFDVALLVLAVLEWNAWILPRPASLGVGLVLSGAGAWLFLASSRSMTGAETAGRAADTLHTEGLYARTRNPQYLGMIVGMVGFALLANALLVSVLVGLHVFWVLLLPFAEEPWLRERFGDQYEAYCERVPRFVDRRSVWRP